MTVRMTQVARRHAADEQGLVLILALAFLGAFGLIISVLLLQVGANLKTTTIVRSRSERSYDADGAVEQGIQLLAVDSTRCTQPIPEDLPFTRLNVDPTGPTRTTTLSCKVVGDAGFSVGAAGWAAIVHGDLDWQGGGGGGIKGPVYVEGAISGSGIVVEGGSVRQADPACAAGQPSGLTVMPDPPYRWECGGAIPRDPAHILPPVPTTTDPLPGSEPGGCRVFYPGRYTTPPSLGDANYFVSGTYYFDFPDDNSAWTASGTTVGGYNPTDPTQGAPCVAGPPFIDATPGGGGSGYGVQWIFGGRSHITLEGDASILLHTRVPGPDAPAATSGISVQTVESTGSGYTATTPGTTVIGTAGGQPRFTSFGLVYAKGANLALAGPVGDAVLSNGVVVDDLSIELTNASPGSFGIGPGTSASGRRFVELTAKATSSGEADVYSRAVVEIRNATSPPVVLVQSWRTTSGVDTG